MSNRLGDIRNNRQTDIEMSVRDSTQDAYLKEITNIKSQINRFKIQVNEVAALHETSLSLVNDQQIKENSSKIDKETDKTKGMMQTIKQDLKDLGKIPKTPGQDKIRGVQYNTTKKQFMSVIKDYQKLEQGYRNRYKDRMQHQYKIVRPEATEEELSEVLGDNIAQPVFAQNVLMSARVGAAKKALVEVEERHTEIQKIVKSIEELQSLFEELQYMVEEQDVMIDTAVVKMEETETYLKDTNVQVLKAKNTALSSRKKKWILFFCCVILIVVVVIIIYFTVIQPMIENNKKDSNNTQPVPNQPSLVSENGQNNPQPPAIRTMQPPNQLRTANSNRS